MRDDPLIAMMLIIVPLSLAAVGGASSIYAPLQHQTVDVHHWLTDREFLEMFALARVTPGPGSMIATLIGWKVAGLPGALVATLSLFVPSCLVCFFIARAWNKYRGTEWHTAIETGLRPLAGGLVLAAVAVLLRLAETGPLSWGVVAVATAILMWRPKLHPAIVLAGGAVIFLAAQAAGLTTL
jgi:chromate transporter